MYISLTSCSLPRLHLLKHTEDSWLSHLLGFIWNLIPKNKLIAQPSPGPQIIGQYNYHNSCQPLTQLSKEPHLWDVRMTAFPLSRIFITVSQRRRRAFGSMPVDGSSSKITEGFPIVAIAVLSRRLFPPLQIKDRDTQKKLIYLSVISRKDLAQTLLVLRIPKRPRCRHPRVDSAWLWQSIRAKNICACAYVM